MNRWTGMLAVHLSAKSVMCLHVLTVRPDHVCFIRGKFVPRPPLHAKNNPRLWWIANQRVSGVFLHTRRGWEVGSVGIHDIIFARSTLVPWEFDSPGLSLFCWTKTSSIWPNTSSACAHTTWILISSRSYGGNARRQGFTIPSEFHAFGDNPRWNIT